MMSVTFMKFNDSKHQEVSSYFADWPFDISDLLRNGL